MGRRWPSRRRLRRLRVLNTSQIGGKSPSEGETHTYYYTQTEGYLPSLGPVS